MRWPLEEERQVAVAETGEPQLPRLAEALSARWTAASISSRTRSRSSGELRSWKGCPSRLRASRIRVERMISACGPSPCSQETLSASPGFQGWSVEDTGVS